MELTPDVIKTIEEILRQGKTVEIAVRNGKLIVWAVTNKRKLEKPLV